MIILLIILGILAIILCLVIRHKYGEELDFIEEVGIPIIALFLVVTILNAFLLLVLVLGNNIDEKIQICAEENKTIETRIDSLVEKYICLCIQI